MIHRLRSVLQRFPIFYGMRTRLKVRQLSKQVLQPNQHTSYAQVGEDLIVAYLAKIIGLTKITYLDIGAFHPVALSNTFAFYEQGHRGVCIEPDPARCAHISKTRPNDVVLNIGIGINAQSEAEFYIMTSADLCTFSRDEAERLTKFGQKIERVVNIPLRTVNSVMEEHFTPWPNFVSMDIEGLDLAVLRTFDFVRFRPEVFCIETLDSRTQREKDHEIHSLMASVGYEVFADTFINTIFVRSELLKCLGTNAE
jgi:FkbM family methyltransferase